MSNVSEQKLPFWHGVEPYHWMVFFGCWMGGIFDGMDSNLFAVILPNAIQELSHSVDKTVISQMGSQVTFLFLIGWTAGGIIFGVLGDKLGRVKAMVLSILLYSLFTGLAGFAHEGWQLAICRFLTGLGIGGELVSISTLLSETWPERSRAFAVGSLLSSYQVGVFISGVITSIIHDWRMAFFVGALPALLAIFVQTKLHEPDKWHQSKETKGGLPIKEIFTPEFRGSVIVGAVAFGGLLIGYWASLSWIPTWIQDLVGADGTGQEKSIATMYHGLAAVCGCLLSGYLADLLGRRSTIMVSYLGAFLVSWLMFSTVKEFSPWIYVFDAMLGFFIGIAQAIMYVYLPELFPTRVRATAIGFCLNAGRLSAAVAVLNVGLVVSFFHGYAGACLAFSMSYLVAVLAGIWGRETRGEPLPD